MSERTLGALRLSYLRVRIRHFVSQLLRLGTSETSFVPVAEDVQLGEAFDDAGLPFEPTSFHPRAPGRER